MSLSTLVEPSKSFAEETFFPVAELEEIERADDTWPHNLSTYESILFKHA